MFKSNIITYYPANSDSTTTSMTSGPTMSTKSTTRTPMRALEWNPAGLQGQGGIRLRDIAGGHARAHGEAGAVAEIKQILGCGCGELYRVEGLGLKV